jgi:hypothetical protein
MALDDKTLSALSKPQLDTIQKIHDEAIRQGVNPEFAVAIAEAETGGKFLHKIGDKILTSPAGAKGVMQIMPDTAQLYNKKFNLNINPEDEDSNIKGSIFILKDLLGKYKNPRFATAMYNASPKAAGQFVSMYQQDPDKAITSLPEETQKYLYRISKNFNLDDDKATGLYTAQPAEATEGEEKPPPFVPVADTFPAKTEEDNKPPPTPAGDVVSPGAGALTGALASTVGQYPFTAELQTAKPPPDLDAAEKAAGKAQRQFEIAEQRLNQRVNSGRPITGGSHLVILEDEYKRSQAALQLAEKQLQDAVAAQKAKVAPTPPAANSMASATPQIITDPNAPVSRTATEQMMQGTIDQDTGTTGRQRQNYNEVTSFRALQAAEQEKALAEAAKSGIVPDSGQKARLAFGMPDATPSGILVQPEVAAPLKQQAELEQRMADDQAAKEKLAQQQEMDRLKNEKALAAQQNSEAQRRFNEAQRAKTSGVTRAQTTMETAEDRARLLAEELDDARRAAKTAPGTTERVLQNTGAKVGKGSNIVKGGLGALGGYEAAKGINTLANLSLSDLQKRYDNGDRSPQLMDALKKAAEATVQVTAGTAAAMPAFGPTTSKIKGAGVLGTGALGAYQAWNALNKTAIERRKNPQQ